MVEITEDDLARELEELKSSEQKAEGGGAAGSTSDLPIVPS